MRLDNLKRCILDEHDGLELLYQNKPIEDASFEKSVVEQYNNSVTTNRLSLSELKNYVDISQEEFDTVNQQTWYMTQEYKDLDIKQYLLNKTSNEIQTTRVMHEYKMFEERGMLDVLRFMVYLIDTMRKNNIVWGVGRGSSVSSYILYLIGVHKVDSIKFELDIEEFLR